MASGGDSLPLIDLSGFDLGSDAGLQGFAAALDAAFSRAGFCYLGGHAIDSALTDALLAQNRRFHAQPQAAKDAVAINEFHRGYMGFATSQIVTSSVEVAQKPNQSESYLAMHELAPNDPAQLAGLPLQGPNPWPQNLPGFKETLQRYVEALGTLARGLVRATGCALGVGPSGLEEHFENPTTFLRLLHYPPQRDPEAEKLYGSAPHTDYGFLTFLLQDDKGGLEVLDESGRWLPATPHPGCFVVNLGDMAMRWSNGRWRSTRHRVINRADCDRYSAPFFFDPHMDCIVAPLAPTVPPGTAPRFGAVRYGDYLMARLDANHDYRRGPENSTAKTL